MSQDTRGVRISGGPCVSDRSRHIGRVQERVLFYVFDFPSGRSFGWGTYSRPFASSPFVLLKSLYI